MTHLGPARDVVIACVLSCLSVAGTAWAQEGLALASTLYASARYDEALGVLDRLKSAEDTAPADALGIEKYRALCFLALGRDSDAEAAFAQIVRADPSYQLDPKEVAPSVRAFYRSVRQRTLPEVAQAGYAEARAAYERKEHARAAEGFRFVLQVLDDEDMKGRLADLRVLAEDFKRLSEAAMPAPAAAPAAASPPVVAPSEPPPPPPPPAPPVYGAEDAGITPPVVMRQVLPPVPTGIQALGRPNGLYELTIDESGRVVAIVVRTSLDAAYDRRFVEAAATWQYRPALLDSRPVRYRKLIQISVAR